ncbi:MAG: serine hydrolase [Dehalococcoidia bacterium]|nr:serine hydrolase [Dehalococcoidia bacterium]
MASSRALDGTTIRHAAMAVGGVAAALAVMGGSLALALGVLGDERPLPTRPPSAVVGGAGGAGGGSVFSGDPPQEERTPVPEGSASPAGEAVETPTPNGVIPENVNVSPEFLALRDTLAKEIEAYAAQVGGIEVGIAVTDLQTGETISLGGNDLHRTGCTINMFALFAAVGEFQAGRADPDSVAYNVNVGIGHSFPPQVYRLLGAVFPSYPAGVARGQELMRSWGMVASEFNQVPFFPLQPRLNRLTALETNMVLTKLYRGQLFEPEWTEYTLARLRNIAPYLNYILPGQLPRAATVAHKIGYFWDRDGWVNNDAGLVTFTGADGKEKAYVITYLSQKARTEYTGYSFGARLSGIVWDYFEATYEPKAGVLDRSQPPSPPPPPPPAPRPSPTQPPATPTLPPAPSPTPPPPPPSPTPTPSPAATQSPTP